MAFVAAALVRARSKLRKSASISAGGVARCPSVYSSVRVGDVVSQVLACMLCDCANCTTRAGGWVVVASE